MIITVFKDLLGATTPIYADVFKVLEQIRSGGDKKELIEEIRTLDGNEYKTAKKKLPVICFGGQFGTRSKDGIINGSGLATLDFDDGTEEELISIRKEIESESYTFSTFTSPRGRGRFKALIKIPLIVSDSEYKKYFAALNKKYKTVDKACKDISRCNFFTYDPDIYINKNATIWDKKHETPTQKKEVKRYKVKDWDSVTMVLNKIETAEDGYKHLSRTKIGYLMGGWIANKDIGYGEAMKLLEDAVSKNTTDLQSAMKTVKSCVEAGMSQPLSMRDARDVMKMEFSAPRRYKPMSEVWDDVKEFYENGYKRGWDIGFKGAEEYITILEGATSYWYSKPADGKSQVWHEILMNITTHHFMHGKPFYNCLLSPETGDVAQIYGELISIHAQQSFVGDFKMSDEQMRISADFVSKYFLILDYEGDSVVMKDIFIQVEAAEREFNMKFNTVTIDPLNYLDFSEGKYSRRDLAIAKDLDYLLADARKNNRHNALITHARDQQIQKNSDGQWYYPLVSPREILDGQQFFRKGMMMVSVYRPLDIKGEPLPDENGIPAEINETQLWVQKAKPKGSSKTGMVKLFYDYKKNRYYEKDKFGLHKYAWDSPEQEYTEKEAMNKLNENTGFDSEESAPC